eukprot:scaffold93325_cov60-Phaeocystis_antarctica.AAC.5
MSSVASLTCLDAPKRLRPILDPILGLARSAGSSRSNSRAPSITKRLRSGRAGAQSCSERLCRVHGARGRRDFPRGRNIVEQP